MELWMWLLLGSYVAFLLCLFVYDVVQLVIGRLPPTG